jgi:hypothetical protein
VRRGDQVSALLCALICLSSRLSARFDQAVNMGDQKKRVRINFNVSPKSLPLSRHCQRLFAFVRAADADDELRNWWVRVAENR